MDNVKSNSETVAKSSLNNNFKYYGKFDINSHLFQNGKHRCMGCMEMYSDEYDICPFCGYLVDCEIENALHMYPGTLLHERYIIGKVIGYGGFGVTYVAWDIVLGIKVAIKEYLPSEFSTRSIGQTEVTIFSGDKTIQFNDGMGKFIDEAKRLAKFRNEHGIVKIFDSFNENSTAYIVMEYLRGETLAERLEREKTIQIEEAIQMLMPIIESLNRVHDEGIIHRDIAPDNIFLTDDGEVKLIDFGAARYATTSRSRSLTVIIKPGYSAEEQYRSRGDQGPHTDVYSVGACLYKMITGITPPDAMERRALFEKKHKDMLVPINKLVSGIDENRANAIYNAMNVRIEDRTSDMISLAGELLSDEPIKRRRSGIAKIDPLTWPLWAKIGIPAALSIAVVFSVLLAFGVVGPHSNLNTEYVVPEGQTLVPDIVGYNMEKAEKKLAKNDLSYLIANKITSDVIGMDLVLMQNPDAFNVVDIGSAIEITKSEGHGIGTVPKVEGLELEIAKEKIEAAGFIVVVVEEESDIVAPGYVISQSEKESTLVEKQTKITLVVSKGGNNVDTSKTVEIPDLVGLTQSEAEEKLKKMHLYVSVEYVYNGAIERFQIVGQLPVKGTKAHQGDIVTLSVNQGEKMVTVVDVREKTLESALSELEKLGFDVYTVPKESDIYKSGTVFEQSVPAGKQVKPGTKITLTYSSGQTISVPDVVGMKLSKAENLLMDAHLSVSSTYKTSSTVPKDTIISQSPTAKSKVQIYDCVSLVVSSGEKEKVIPEEMVGKLTSIYIDSFPQKTTYYVGDSLDKSGIKIVAMYSDGSSKDITDQCTYSTEKFNIKGSQTITVRYREDGISKSATFSVTVNEKRIEFANDSITLKKGTSEKISATNLPSNVIWSTSDSSVATVKGGVVTGVNVGQAIIRASSAYATSASCVVHVVSNDISVEKITLDKTSVEINEYSKCTLTATVIPTNATNSSITWSSSNTDVAKVSSGTVTGVAAGTATITAKASNGLTAKCTVKVKELKVKSITPIGTYKTEYYPGDKIDLTGLELDVEYEGGLHKTVTSQSEYTYKVQDKGEWNKVVVITYKGVSTNINIEYNEAGVTVSSSTGDKSVYTGGSLKLIAKTNPVGYNITSWASNNESVATVNSSGIVTGKKAGKAVITAKFKYGSGSITITVKEVEVSGIEIKTKPKTTGYYIGDEIDTTGLVLKVNYNGADSTETSIGYTINPEKITSETGSQTVTVNWGSKTATYTITKIKTPTITISRENLDMKDGDQIRLTATTEPSGQQVEWSSAGHVSVNKYGTVSASGSGNGSVTAQMDYKGRTYEANCKISVTGIEVTSISLEGNYKTSGYYPGDNITTSGMSVRVNYSDGSHKNVSNGFSISPQKAKVDTPITVSYGGKTTSYDITISTPSIKIKVDGSSKDSPPIYRTETHSVSYELTPSGGKWTDGQWVISGNSVQVNGTAVYASKPGIAEIRYEAKYNGVLYSSSAITINVKELEIVGYKVSNFDELKNIKYEDLEASDIRIQVEYSNGDIKYESFNKNSNIGKYENADGGYAIDIYYDGEDVDSLFYDENGIYIDHANNS